MKAMVRRMVAMTVSLTHLAFLQTAMEGEILRWWHEWSDCVTSPHHLAFTTCVEQSWLSCTTTNN